MAGFGNPIGGISTKNGIMATQDGWFTKQWINDTVQ
jgi:hypothetical protein